MAEFVVLRVSSGQVPSLGEKGSADAYRGDHVDAAAAVVAASNSFNAGPGVFLYAVPIAQLTRYVVSRSVAVG